MDPLLAILALLLLALLGAKVSFSTRRVPAGPRLLFRTGIQYLFAGFAIGPGGLGLLTEETVAQLEPLMALALGWIGLLFGLQLDRSSLRQFPRSYHAFAFGQAALALALFWAVGEGFLALLGFRGELVRLLVVMAAATACVTTPAGIAMVSSNFLVRGNVGRLLFFAASVDALVGVLALQGFYAVFHPGTLSVGSALPPILSVVVALGLGLVSGILLLWLDRSRPDREELVLFLLGIAALVSGAAFQLSLSPLFVSVVVGVLVANLARDRQRVFQVVEKWEKPVYVTLLLLAGALLRMPRWWILPLAIGYALLRSGAKIGSGALMVRAAGLDFPVPRRVGLGLIPQGGISLAMAVSILLTYGELDLPGGESAAQTVFGVIVLGVVISELVGPFLTHNLLRRAGEISDSVEAALAAGNERKAEAAAIRQGAPPPPRDPRTEEDS